MSTSKPYDEVFLSRALAREIDLALKDGKELPLNVVLAFNELMRLYEKQMDCGEM